MKHLPNCLRSAILIALFFGSLPLETPIYAAAPNASFRHALNVENATNTAGTPMEDAPMEDVPSNAHAIGQWSPVIDWPVLMIHASLLPNGKILAWDANADDFDGDPHTNDDKTTRAVVWDPETGLHFRVDPDTESDLFCSGHAHLPDGSLFVAGGDTGNDGAIDKTNIFSPLSNTWTGVANMSYARWYPSVTPLANGEMLVSGGTPGIPEVWSTDNGWRSLPNINLGVDYPWLQTTPTGDVIYVGPGKTLRRLNTSGDGRATNAGPRDLISRTYGSYAMYDIGKILVTGGGPSTTSSVEIDATTGVVTPTGALGYGRRQHNLTVLPDGTVLVTGGNSSGEEYIDINNSVFAAELWDPTTGQWSVMAHMQTTRQYHSAALLLPDARVLTGGGGRCALCEEIGYHAQNAEIFSPPYLFKDDGSGDLAPRPVIGSAPQALSYGYTFSIDSVDAESIAHVSLVRLSSVTHSVNMEQRLIPLTFTASSTFLNVAAPAHANIAPPGYYMLFVIDDSGVPSVAEFVQISPEAPVSTAPPVVTYSGDQSGSEADSVAVEITAYDPDNNGMTFSATGLPDGLTIEEGTGLITGTLTYLSAGLHNITVTVNDGVEEASVSFLWSVANVNRPPVLTDPEGQQSTEHDEIVLDLLVSEPDEEPLTFSASTLPDGLSIGATSGRISGTLSYESSGTYSVTVDVTDGEASDSIMFSWSVANLNRPPVVTQLDGQSNNEQDIISLQVAASDPDGSPVIFSATLPTGLSIDEDDGHITGTLSYISAGNHAATITVGDGITSTVMTVDWVVHNVNQLPTIEPLDDQANREGEAVALAVVAVDLDNESIFYRAEGLPDGLIIDSATGSIAGTLSYTSSGDYATTISVSDGIDTVSTNFDWLIRHVNRPPSITIPDDQADAEGDSVSLAIQATDPDGDSLLYTAEGLPAALSINPSTGQISGVLPFVVAENYQVRIVVDDGTDQALAHFIWSVGDVNRPPKLFSPGALSNRENASIALQIEATDPDEAVLTYAASHLPPGVEIDPRTGILSGVLSFESAGVYTTNVTVSDGELFDAIEFVWTVEDTNRLPTIQDLTDQTLLSGATISLQVVAADPDNNMLIYSATGLPAGVTINSDTGLISGVLEDAGKYTSTIIVEDGSHSIQYIFNWIIAEAKVPGQSQNEPKENNIYLPYLR